MLHLQQFVALSFKKIGKKKNTRLDDTIEGEQGRDTPPKGSNTIQEPSCRVGVW